MAGMFELFIDAESAFRFRLTAPDGTIMAVSRPFDTKTDAVAGIAAVREYAGMGLITDHSTTTTNSAPPQIHDDPAATDDSLRAPKIDFHARQGGSQGRLKPPLGRGNTQPLLSAGEGSHCPFSASFTESSLSAFQNRRGNACKWGVSRQYVPAQYAPSGLACDDFCHWDLAVTERLDELNAWTPKRGLRPGQCAHNAQQSRPGMLSECFSWEHPWTFCAKKPSRCVEEFSCRGAEARVVQGPHPRVLMLSRRGAQSML